MDRLAQIAVAWWLPLVSSGLVTTGAVLILVWVSRRISESMPSTDPAADALRLEYARGNISRTDYEQQRPALGNSPAPPVSGVGARAWMPYLAGLLAIAAGLIHFVVTPQHFQEGTEFGLFMVTVGVAQVVAGLLLLIHPSRAVVVATILGSVVVFAVFAVAYTVGLPLGPDPGQPEVPTPSLVASKIIEIALVGTLVTLLENGDPEAQQLRSTFPHMA